MMYKPHPTLFIVHSLQPKTTRPEAIHMLHAISAMLRQGAILQQGLLPFGVVLEGDPSLQEELQHQLGNKFVVEPALQDKQERVLFPTGEIMIRFKSSLTKKQLTLFAKEHHLVLVGQNEFIKEQAKFQSASTKPTRLLKILAQLQGAKQIEAVWPVTLSSYQRGEPTNRIHNEAPANTHSETLLME
jgi:hypothetical protein